MTAREVLDNCVIAGLEIVLCDGKPYIRGGQPNAALLAAIREHRTEIIRILGGNPEPEWCGTREDAKGRLIVCNSWVFEAVDSEAFCTLKGCPFRQRVRA